MDIDESLESTPRLHTKRLAREIAMQYLFSCDMLNEFPELSKFDDFFEEEMKAQFQVLNTSAGFTALPFLYTSMWRW